MTHPLIPPRELDFLLYEWLKADALFAQPCFAGHDRETIDAMFGMAEKLAVDHFLPCCRQGDMEEPRLDADGVHILPAIGEALRNYADLGLFSAGFAPELGGLGLPTVICSAAFAQFAAANIAAAAYPMLTTANARLIAHFGSAAQIATFALPQIEGRWFGTMCLSEPQAGSSLADVRTRANPDSDDEWGPRYRLVGNKMWISGGDQDVSENIVHLVLAKVPDGDGQLPEGTAGLSLFIVPKLLPDGRRNDVVVAGLNHKMGYRGTANCLLNFGENDGAIGWRVGAPGQGLQQMFLMMNEARIGVGIGAAALAYRGYRHSVRYAQDRLQGREPGRRTGPPVPIIEHADVRRMLIAQKAYAEGALALCLYCALLVDEAENPDQAALLGLLTPIAKTWPAEHGLAANDLAIQVHGGYGYTRDFDVEQLYRDNRLNPIHEGTTGIQAADLLGRKILRGDGAGLVVLRDRIAATRVQATAIAELARDGETLADCWAQIEAVIANLRAAPPALALDNATAFLSAMGHCVIAWLWLDQALAAGQMAGAGEHTQRLANGKRSACRYYFDFEVPRIAAWLAPVNALSGAAARIPLDIF